MAKEPIYKGKDKNGKGVWEIQVNTGVAVTVTYKDPDTGEEKTKKKYTRITETIHGTKAEAKKRLREIETANDNGINVRGGKVAFDAYAKQWLAEKSATRAPRTVAGYKTTVTRLCNILGNTPLEKIDAPAARNVLATLRGTIKGHKGKPSETTVLSNFKVFSMIMEQAEADDLIRRNPCTKVAAPKAEAGTRRSMTVEQYKSLQLKVEDATYQQYSSFAKKERHLKATGHQNKPRAAIRDIHEAAYLVAVRIVHATGARPSEVFALQWKHIDFVEGCIRIEQATKTQAGGVKPTKSSAGKRNIYLDPRALEYLAEWRRFQASAANALGMELGTESWVVCTDAFTQVHTSNFSKWWKKWSDENGFGGWEVYELRHTQATLLLDAGADIKTVQKRLGHSSAAVTLNVYAHALESSQREAAALLPSIA